MPRRSASEVADPMPAHVRGTVLIANPGADLYGSDRMAVETVAALSTADYRVVVTVPEAGPLIDLLQEAGAQVVVCRTPIIRKSALRPVGMLRLLVDTLKAMGPSVRLLRRVRPSVLIVNTITPPLWFLLARLLRIPVIGHVHEAEASVSRPIRLALAVPLLFAQRLVVNSHFSLDVVCGAVPQLRRRSTVIYNAVPGPPEVVDARSDLVEPIRLLYVGRLSARKGPDVAARAVGVLRDRGRSVRLDLTGAVYPGYEWFENDLRAELTEAALTDWVQFSGFKSDRWPATAAADIVLIPSTLDEPFGNVAVEAGLAARPQVVSDISGLREAAGGIRSAIRVPAADPGAIADAVEKIIAAWPAYRRDARRDARELAERYSRERYRSEILEIVEQIRRDR